MGGKLGFSRLTYSHTYIQFTGADKKAHGQFKPLLLTQITAVMPP